MFSKTFPEFYKLKKIISKNHYNFSLFLLMLVLIGTFFEMMGIGALFPLLTFISTGNIDFFHNLNIYFNLNLDTHNNNFLIKFFAILILTIYFLKSLYLTFLSYIFATFTKNIKIYLTIKLFKKYLSLNFLSMMQKNSNIAINTITKEVDELSSNFIIPLIILINEFIVATGILLFIIYLYPTTSIFLVGILSFFGFVFLLVSKKYNTIWGQKRLKYSELSLKNINQSLNAFKEIKLSRNQNTFVAKLSDFINIKISSETKQSILDQIPRFWLEFITLISVLSYSFFFISTKQYSELIPIIGIFALAGFRILPSLNRIVTTLQIIRYGKASINKIYEELNFLKNNKEIYSKSSFTDTFKSLSIQNLNFCYPNNKINILNNININISKNEFIGIVGESGSGKTTLINLISGLIRITKGSILVNNINLNDINTDWQKKIGYVPQNIFLLDDTIKKNIAFEINDSIISEEQINKSIKLAMLENFINELPENENTQIGERGNKLSGGQIQRIGIARALYNQPEILILDEPTSALDEKKEKKFIENLNKIKNNITIIIISHKYNAIKYCDKVFELFDGKIKKIDLKVSNGTKRSFEKIF